MDNASILERSATATALSCGLKRAVTGAVAGAWIATMALPATADATEKFSRHTAGATKVIDHSAWDKLLKTYVVADRAGLNRVRYQAFKAKGHGALKRYVKMLEGVRPTTLARPEQFAYWANLYNAKTIDVVLDAYPVKSIREISINGGLFDLLKKSVGKGGPWKAKIMQVEGEKLSLDDIEHGIMRPVFKDPRVHYAVNCASVGCPNLQTAAFTGAKLDKMLDAGAKAYINSSRGFQAKSGRITASSIYDWFVADFGGSARGALKHAAKYAKPALAKKLAKAIAIADYEYDWSLNDAN
ncbi:MAG: DUF547 domain-containing protein [Hyphomicrobiaceae bacterium]